MNKDRNEYLAHVDWSSGRRQSMKEHSDNVAFLASEMCMLPELRDFAWMVGKLHDAGKLGSENQQDFENILLHGDGVHRNDLDHSTAGGWIGEDLIEKMIEDPRVYKAVAELLSNAIYFHHGIGDCISLKTGELVTEQRRRKEIAYEEIDQRFFQIYDRKVLEEKCVDLRKAYLQIDKKIDSFKRKYNMPKNNCGTPYFYMGMYLRVLLSLLIDADWTDTACFFQNEPLKTRIPSEEMQRIWEKTTLYFENYLVAEVEGNPDNGSALNQIRQKISETCRDVAKTEENLYRLTVPTGAGKTLSSLRFALHHAKEKKKQHIFYVAPFNAILEQNAEEIRKATENPEIVLEHHCNVVCEEGEEEKYRSLTETWDVPIIVTTAVQMLNTLFSDKKSSIRRMHTLCNSIIIFDEVQAIPVRCMELFHLAVNFLSKFCNTTIILCSATQPSLAKLQENNICPCKEMVDHMEMYQEQFRRTSIIDGTKLQDRAMTIENLADFAWQNTEQYHSTLCIVNTTAAAFQLFQELKRNCTEDYNIYHLSNNMCPQHKLDTLEQIRKGLKDRQRKIICVSTQLVEAGVNFSFGCVIRSKAGLDNVIQAAGRCNRHKEFTQLGAVYIVDISKDVEKLDKLYEIAAAQQALQKTLDDFDANPEYFHQCLDSEQAVTEYYRNYQDQIRLNETKFPVPEYDTTLVELLGKNKTGTSQYCRTHGMKKSETRIPQAFATAGKIFEVIEDNHKVNVVVPYCEEARELVEELVACENSDGSKIIRKLQRYTVGITIQRKENLSNAIHEYYDGKIFMLADGYYDGEVGVVDEPIMQTLLF